MLEVPFFREYLVLKLKKILLDERKKFFSFFKMSNEQTYCCWHFNREEWLNRHLLMFLSKDYVNQHYTGNRGLFWAAVICFLAVIIWKLQLWNWKNTVMIYVENVCRKHKIWFPISSSEDLFFSSTFSNAWKMYFFKCRYDFFLKQSLLGTMSPIMLKMPLQWQIVSLKWLFPYRFIYSTLETWVCLLVVLKCAAYEWVRVLMI